MHMELSLDTPVRFVPHIGPVMAGRLANLEIATVQDLLYHVPFRYDDFTNTVMIGAVRPDEVVTVRATIESIRNFFTKSGKKIQEARVADATGKLSVIWFNQTYLLKILHPGDFVNLSGKVSWFGHKLVLTSPAYELGTSLNTGRLVPVYPETAGLSSKWLRGRIAYLLENVALADFLPTDIRMKHNLIDLPAALRAVHFPENTGMIEKGRHRIAFDEVLLLQAAAHEARRLRETTQKARAVASAQIPQLPFTLTRDQKNAIGEILGDMGKTVPMNRLLVGDVGSGKTVVAATAMYAAHKSGYRSLLMAPTQILAHQHWQTIKMLLPDISVGLVTSSVKEDADILVGTHALLSEKLKNVGLVVIDEQQRFGVSQRAALTKRSPHFLTMTATPIPRTIAKTLLGNLDVSILNEMPKGRIPVKTWVVPTEKRTAAYDWIKKQPGQVFVICPLIEASETLDGVKAVKEEFEKMKKIFSSVGILHGRMKTAEKTKALADFRDKKTSVLVATPVVEVGIDVPDATIMVIEAADRFGLGQLHQLRGRVGRGAEQSYCLLFTDNDDAVPRLTHLARIQNGPALAEIDLKLRGPGEVFGTRQHGLPHLKIASFTDMKTLGEAQEAVTEAPEPLLRELTKKVIITSTKD